MTINSTTRKAGPFVGNGTVSAFPFGFKVFQASDLFVVRLNVSAAVEQTLVLNSDYSVTLNPDQNSNPGGVVTLSSALASGYTLTLTSDVPDTQPTDLTNQGGFYPEVINDALDRATIQIQQLQEETDRTITAPISTPAGTDLTFPLPDANKFIGWNSTATGLQNLDGSTLASIVAFATAYADTFNGDGVTSTFALSYPPATVRNLDVSINGVTQVPVIDYDINGQALNFTTPPPLGSVVLAKYWQALPNSSGAAQDFTLTPNGYTTAVDVQEGFDDLGSSAGTSKIGFLQAGTGAQARSAQDKLREIVSVKDFGAIGDGVTDDTAAIQAAVDATPTGTTIYFPAGTYAVSDEIRINKPLVVRGAGPGSFIADTGGAYLKQTDNTKNGFTLVPTAGGYAFGQWGILDVHFFDLAVVGPATGNRAQYGIGVDTSVNGGDYHVRECTFNNLNIRYFNTAVNLTGICYLNDFYGSCFSYCDNGFELARGAASDTGGQTRFFGTAIDLITNDCIRWNLDTVSGDIALFGCTLADAKRGLVSNEEATITAHGCSFEALQNAGSGAGVYIEIKEANPNSDSAKNIVGCKFFNNDASIWLDKTTSAGSTGNFAWPMLIDANTLGDANALKITQPVGHLPMNSQQFVLGSANSGANNGQVATSQISANYKGRDMRQQVITRQFAFGPTTPVSTVLVSGMVVTSARVYLSANSSVFTALFIGDADNNQRYAFFDAQAQALNTWVNWTPTVPPFVINSDLKLNLVIGGTAGLSGATGVFEISGYIP